MIIKKMPPLKLAQQDATTPRKKTNKIPTDTDTEQLIQKFFVTHSEKQVTVKFGNAYFGIKKDNILEKFMRGTENKDAENIGKILDLIKMLMKANISTKQIAEKFNATQEITFSQTIKQYLNALNKPTPAKIITNTKDKHPITPELLDTE